MLGGTTGHFFHYEPELWLSRSTMARKLLVLGIRTMYYHRFPHLMAPCSGIGTGTGMVTRPSPMARSLKLPRPLQGWSCITTTSSYTTTSSSCTTTTSSCTTTSSYTTFPSLLHHLRLLHHHHLLLHHLTVARATASE